MVLSNVLEMHSGDGWERLVMCYLCCSVSWVEDKCRSTASLKR